MRRSEVQIAIVAALLALAVSGCADTKTKRFAECPILKPGARDGWVTLSGPPADYQAMLASLDDKTANPPQEWTGFMSTPTWYKRSDSEYMAHEPPLDEHGCWETTYTFTKSAVGWIGKVNISCECTS